MGLPAGAPCTGSTGAALGTVSGRDVGSWQAPADLPESASLPVLRETGKGGKVPYKSPEVVLHFPAAGNRALCCSRRSSSPWTMDRCLWPPGRAAAGSSSAAPAAAGRLWGPGTAAVTPRSPGQPGAARSLLAGSPPPPDRAQEISAPTPPVSQIRLFLSDLDLPISPLQVTALTARGGVVLPRHRVTRTAPPVPQGRKGRAEPCSVRHVLAMSGPAARPGPALPAEARCSREEGAPRGSGVRRPQRPRDAAGRHRPSAAPRSSRRRGG